MPAGSGARDTQGSRRGDSASSDVADAEADSVRGARQRAQDKPTKRTAAESKVLTTLPAVMTGRASPAKAAVGDRPVSAYISSLPQPQRSIAERADALAGRTLPDLQRSVKWGMAWYGFGWCFSCGGFAGHVKLTFGRGTALTPVPPVAPIGIGQGLARRGPRISGRHRRTPTRVVDEAGHGHPRFRGEKAMSPATAGSRTS